MSSSFVRNRQTAWLLYNEGKAWNVRPSTLLTIEDEYVSFCLDQALNYWGHYIEGELDQIDGDKPQQVEAQRRARLEEILFPGKPKSAKGFADPALMFS